MKTTEVLTMRGMHGPENVVDDDSWNSAYRPLLATRFDFYQFDIRLMLENYGAAVLLNGEVIYDGLWYTYSPEGGAVTSVFQRSKPIIVDTVTDLFGKHSPHEGDDQERNLRLLLEKVEAPRAHAYAEQRINGLRRALGRVSRSK